ncbi:MAG: hypothetical protein WC521_01635 [Bdellovibrionales bacterium]
MNDHLITNSAIEELTKDMEHLFAWMGDPDAALGQTSGFDKLRQHIMNRIENNPRVMGETLIGDAIEKGVQRNIMQAKAEDRNFSLGAALDFVDELLQKFPGADDRLLPILSQATATPHVMGKRDPLSSVLKRNPHLANVAYGVVKEGAGDPYIGKRDEMHIASARSMILKASGISEPEDQRNTFVDRLKGLNPESLRH